MPTKLPRSFVGGVVALQFAGLAYTAERRTDSGFIRFPETVSPDGKYCLGWGVKAKPNDDARGLAELPFEEELDFEADVEDFVIEMKSRKVVATIPGLDYFASAHWHKNRGSLTVAWSPDSRFAVAIQGGRYGTEGTAWIDVRQQKATSIEEDISDVLRAIVRQKHGKKAESQRTYVHFDRPVFQGSEVLLLDCTLSGFISKFEEEIESFDYRLKLNVAGTGEGRKVRLLASRGLSSKETEYEYIDDGKVEAELNKAYGALRSKLDSAGKETLKAEELVWLKLREEMPTEEKKLDFTRIRIRELRGRAEAF
jgi:uncharacterized protein YecT (DUF1311 family)